MNKLIEGFRYIKNGDYTFRMNECDHLDKDVVKEFNDMINGLHQRDNYVNNQVAGILDQVKNGSIYF